MRRPLIGAQAKIDQHVELSTSSVQRTSTLVGPQLQRRLREKRSLTYVNAMSRLDTGGHMFDHRTVSDLIARIQEEFPEVAPEQFPIGIVAKCYLGELYEVHTLDRELSIIHHYTFPERLPGLLERARSLALHPAYAFIEVYPDQLIAVRADGAVSVTSV